MNLADTLATLLWEHFQEYDIWKEMEPYLIETAKGASGCFIIFDIDDKITDNDFDFYYFTKIVENDGMRYYRLPNSDNTCITSIMMWDKWRIQQVIEENLKFKKVSNELIRVTINKDESSNIKFKIKLDNVDKEAMSKYENYDFSYAC